MSDTDDDAQMDIDTQPASTGLTQLFDDAVVGGKGKRSAANLPIQALDSLPW
jgi:hypothetical protein